MGQLTTDFLSGATTTNFLPSTTLSTSTMKLSAATLVAFLAFSSFSVSAAPTCDECIAAMDALVARLTGETSLGEQISVMVDTICPQAENPEDCITRLTAAWPEIAGLIYPRYLDGNAVCGALGSCALREWTCEECTNGLVQIATIFVQQEYIDDIISFLQGEAYCGAHTDHPTCTEDIAALMPAALPVLASVLTVQAPEICRDNVGVC